MAEIWLDECRVTMENGCFIPGYAQKRIVSTSLNKIKNYFFRYSKNERMNQLLSTIKEKDIELMKINNNLKIQINKDNWIYDSKMLSSNGKINVIDNKKQNSNHSNNEK